ncbi:MAG: hypothetical protein DMG58_08265 [Acidobacteria bacterium]|nr:MAG: hypothetical protein DMG58_08265 [Acidobacteriota bacterium]
MTPSAPTATWRRVCEEYFSRLIEDLEQQVESEVESRVTAAIDAAVRGAVADAASESRRALAEELNQAVRRLRQAANAEDLYAVLLDVTVPFCEQAAVFSIHERVAHAERMRRPAQGHSGENGSAANLPALEFPVSEAAAFSTAIDTRDPVIAMSTPAEVSGPLVELLGHKADERVYLFPLHGGSEVTALFYAAGHLQPPPLELLAEVAGLQLHVFWSAEAAVPVPVIGVQPEPKPGDELVTISASSASPAKPLDSEKAATATAPAVSPVPRQHTEWWNLSRQEQQDHLAAQRFARVQVAEMRLGKPDALRAGRGARNIYASLEAQIDAAREKFREKHMSAPTMVDYLHLEMVRSLAEDDAILLGPNYPGPLV